MMVLGISQLTFVLLQAISCHYAGSSCKYVPVEGTTQEKLAAEIIELARRRLGDPNAEIRYEVSGIPFHKKDKQKMT
jgi:hypothetical protein